MAVPRDQPPLQAHGPEKRLAKCEGRGKNSGLPNRLPRICLAWSPCWSTKDRPAAGVSLREIDTRVSVAPHPVPNIASKHDYKVHYHQRGLMDEKIVEQILDELFSSFEKLETESAAILLFLKDQGIATQEKLAPYLEQSSKMSEVRWRAARVRMGSLLASAMKTAEPPAEKAKKTASDQEKAQAEPKAEIEPEKEPKPTANPKPEDKAMSADDAEHQGEQKPVEQAEAVKESAALPKDKADSPGQKPDERTRDESGAVRKPKK